MGTIHVLGGGTFFDVCNHFSLAMRAMGNTARTLTSMLEQEIKQAGKDHKVQLHLTYMADQTSRHLLTNDDVANLIHQLIADPDTKAIIMNCGMLDFEGFIEGVESGPYAQRLESRNGPFVMNLHAADKVIGDIRKHRKDIFAVGFKTTCGETPQVQYQKGLRLVKENSLNLVLANDSQTGLNMIVTPEESRHSESTDRQATLEKLTKMIVSRMDLHFTRSEVVDAPAVPWNSDEIPPALRTVVGHLIDTGSYKPFLGKTAGHFAVRGNNGTIITSRRKSDFNKLREEGMIRIETVGQDRVIAYGGKPSVGGQSQRIIFTEHPSLDCIAHAHVPLKADSQVPVREQWPFECGSHECGQNTSSGLKEMEPGIWAVYLENHGPNVVFNRNTDPNKVISFMERNFDLRDKTGGSFSHDYQ